MDFEQNLPEWKAQGTEPPASLKEKGFEAGYKPPAGYFNWFWNRVFACLSEIRMKMKEIRTVADGGTGRSSVTAGNLLVGNGTGALVEKTPAEAREHIGAAQKYAAIPVVPATSEDGITYSATVNGLTELTNGLIITIVPEINSASTAVKLNVNNLGEKMVRLPLSFNNAAMSAPRLETYYAAGRPLTIQYDANYTTGGAWKTLGKQRTSAQDLYGRVPIESGGTGAETAEEARNNLGITLENLGAASSDELNTVKQTAEGKASKANYTGTLSASGWSASAPYTQTITINGLLATDAPIVDINMSGATADTAAEIQGAYSLIGRIVAGKNQITAYCYEEVPTVNLPLSLLVVR